MKVFIADPIDASANIMLKNAGLEVIDLSKSKDELMSKIGEADALIVRSATKVTKEFLEKSKNLKIIGRSGVGLDNIDVKECKARKIEVVNSPEGPTKSVAEMVLAMMIICARQLNYANNGTKEGKWPKKAIHGIELYGKTLGIIGSGAIGGTLAKYCIALGMNVIAYDIIQIPELENLEGFKYTSFDETISNADFVSVHVPLLQATKHIINDKAIEKMKQDVVIINAARGGIIDEEALLKGLKSSKIRAVALDVFEKEPIDPKSELISMDNVFVTPHIGAQTKEASLNNTTIVCQKIINYFQNSS